MKPKFKDITIIVNNSERINISGHIFVKYGDGLTIQDLPQRMSVRIGDYFCLFEPRYTLVDTQTNGMLFIFTGRKVKK